MVMPGRSFSATSQYRYGFNDQEKSTEINGSSNLYTAEFWQYDSRLGRRWNVDPKPVIGLSVYVTFKNNPLCYKDLYGDTTYRFNKDGTYSGIADLNKKGIVGSIGEYKTYKDSEGKDFMEWSNSRSFTFNDPNVDKEQLNFLNKGDKALQIVDDGNINAIMKKSGIKHMNIYSRFQYANKESSGGKMDFGVKYFNGEPGGGANDMQSGFFIIGSVNKAYNAMDGGNWLWGQAMNRLGFGYATAKFFSEANEGFKDSAGDQKAIRTGFHYSTAIKTVVPFILTNGSKNKIKF